MTTAYTTLNAIRACDPCAEGWAKLLKSLKKTHADDEPLPLSYILESNGIDDAIWCLRALDDSRLPTIRLFALRVARSVQHLMNDQRSIDALDTVERYLNGEVSVQEMTHTTRAAYAAVAHGAHGAYAAYAAAYAATDAAHAAYAATNVAAHAAYAADAADAADVAYAADVAAYAAIFKELFT